jgi:putative ABC transport system permease protein
MRLLSLFAAVAVSLSAVGIYGVVAYAASLRNREIGLRMALGAQSTQVLGLVLRRGVVMSVAGLFVGLCCAWGVTRVLTTLLFEISPTDPVTFALGAGILFLTSLLASFLPAHRATRVDPMDVLRVD